MTIDETFDVGVDTRTPVDDKDYQVPFRFTGKIDKLTVKLGPVQLTSDEHRSCGTRAPARTTDATAIRPGVPSSEPGRNLWVAALQ